MEKIKKEVLTKENLVADLLKAEKVRAFSKTSSSFAYLILIPLLSITVGIVINIYVGIIISLFAVFFLILLIRQIRISKIRQQAIKNGEYTITTEKLVNICEETALQLHRRYYAAKVSNYMYFSNQKWKIPSNNYTWSELYKLSEAGIINTSLIGDEFYIVLVNDNHEISCVYNTKFFETRDK